jgi:uncharacterized protein YbjT (DUF2867 family)
VVEANLDNVDSVKRAFQGAYGTFCVTFFWAHFTPERELAKAAAMAYAARHEGVEHIIWSTLEDTRKWVPLNDNRMPTLMGKYQVPHFDAKREANHVFSDLGLPVTFLLTSFYWDNFIHFGMGPKRSADGALSLTLPMGDRKLPGIAAEDIGKCVYGVFRRGSEFINETIGIASECLTGPEMAACLTRGLGEPVRYHAITPDEYRVLGSAGAQEFPVVDSHMDRLPSTAVQRAPAVARAVALTDGSTGSVRRIRALRASPPGTFGRSRPHPGRWPILRRVRRLRTG